MTTTKKKILCMILSVSIILGTSLCCFAESNVIESSATTSGWTAWFEGGRYNSTAVFESYASTIAAAALTGGVVFTSVKALAISLTGTSVAWVISAKPDKAYFTTVLEVRYDNSGGEQRRVIRYVYSNSKRTNLKETLYSPITTIYHSTMSLDEDE